MLRNPGTRQTAIWYLNNNVLSEWRARSKHHSWLGPGRSCGFQSRRASRLCTVQFDDRSEQPSGICQGQRALQARMGQRLPVAGNWWLQVTLTAMATRTMCCYNASTHQTAIWYLNNNVYVSGGYGPTLPVNWSVAGVADFNRDGHRDYLLFNSSNHQTAIWYLSGRTSDRRRVWAEYSQWLGVSGYGGL